ncbi:thioredoxin-like protein [Aspergillus minisclerotigenes]|uniref:Thioredoxin-like protein n=1 Tax=Aspergillus minisclerotigenes TaxID=656917 RepID=A0A5N6IV88_9EURO|nr:thioredoxin-like protein [Aspergillus minisclerotigenes]
MSSAQDEFNLLVQSNREKYSTHPEDRDNDSDHGSNPSEDEQDHPQFSDSEDHDPTMRTGSSTYHVPNIVFDANTGPKGVIADAQAFERARANSFRKTLHHNDHAKYVADDSHLLHHTPPPDGSLSDEDEEHFLRQWREERIQELRNRSFRRPSPRRRMYGSVDTVDAVGYLDAIEKVTSDTVVVVCIYNPESKTSALVEDCLEGVARRNPTVRFVKLHHEIAEMDYIRAPALLAYRGGDVFETIVEIVRQIPKGRDCTSHTLEDLLKLYRVL